MYVHVHVNAVILYTNICLKYNIHTYIHSYKYLFPSIKYNLISPIACFASFLLQWALDGILKKKKSHPMIPTQADIIEKIFKK